MRKLSLLLLALAPLAAFAQKSKMPAIRAVDAETFAVTVTPGAVRTAAAGSGWTTATIPGAARTLTAGAPDVPVFSYGILTGGEGATAEILGARYHDVPDIRLAPSKGAIPRTIDPSTLPFVPGPQYAEDKFYPAQPIALGSGYNIRSAAGQSLHVYPVQYNPVRGVLRVYDSLEVAVRVPGAHFPAEEATADWQGILQNHFLNWTIAAQPQGKTTGYTPLPETGSMLIVTPAKYLAALQPFRDWKARRGIRTYVLNTDTLAGGATPAAIGAAVQARYASLALDYLLLVGDADDIPPVENAALYAGPSDAAYAYLAGADHYPDLLVGRLSVSNAAQLAAQITRGISYEKTPVTTAAWYPKAIGIASNEGPGDDNQKDWEHMRALRADLMAAGYTAVSEHYDSTHGGADLPGDPVASDIVAAINGGATLLNYCGHGWGAGLGTSGFSNAEMPQLTNWAGQWPFVFTVACVTGEFMNGTCLAEALTRSVNVGGAATGAIGAYCSTINQSWSPPMEAQDETTRLIALADSLRPHGIGALSVSGAMAMNDAYGPDGDDMTDTWVLFGDPSLQLRTRKPDTLAVTHAATLTPAAGNFSVGVNRRTATVVIMHRDTILSVKRPTGATATIHARPALAVGDSVTVWVTAPNAQPYTRTVKVTQPSTTEEPAFSRWTVSPNPATTVLRITALEAGGATLSDVAGRVVRRSVLALGENEMSVETLSAGAYFLTLRTVAGAVEVQKIVVAR